MRLARCLALCSLSLLVVAGAAGAQQVFPVTLSLSAVAPLDEIGGAVLEKLKVDGDALLNVARGRSPDALVPANEVLALLLDCENESAALIVFDSSGGAVLVTLASLDEGEVASAGGSGALVFDLGLEDVGNSSFGIDGGFLVLAGTFPLGPGGCPAGVKGTASGVLEVTITDDVGTNAITALATKGKFSVAREPIGSVP